MPKLNYTSTGSSTNNPSSSGWTCSPSPSGSSGVCSKNDYSASFNYVCSGQGSHGGWDACQVDSSTSGSSRDYPSGSGRGDHDGGGNGSGSGRRGWSDYESKDNGSTTAVPFSPSTSDFELLFDHPEEGSNGVMNLNSMYYPQVKHVHSLSHLINVRGTMPSGWGHNVFQNISELHLANNLLTDVELSPLLKSLYYQELNLKILDLSFNKLTTNIVGELLHSISNEPGKQTHNIQVLKLNNNQFDDDTAKYFSWHISSGTLLKMNYLDLSGNKITSAGDTQLVQALKGVWQDIAIFTHTLDEIVKMTDGSREEKVAIFRSLIEKGKAIGTYDEAIVVDKSWLGKIKNVGDLIEVSKLQVFGFGKCHLLPDPKETVESYAQDKIIATLPTKTASGVNFAKKYVGKLLSFHDVVTCFVSSREDALTSEIGQQVLAHELCLLGEEEFCGE